ncbi:hypothetical protein G6L37_03750 [Agrobacterium rubi]|nr:hypothetical protein [Agrobacterium rubi]NTF24466.1 hypothetical protein [Agrobacterium rubi]
MTDRLAITTFFEQAEPLSAEIITGFQNIEEDKDIVILPDVVLSDLEQYDYAPDDLARNGLDVPSDPDEAFEYAVSQFRISDAFYEWQESVRPNLENYWLWHCEPQVDDQAVANALHENSLNVCYINGEHLGRTYQGFILIGGGMDFSDELAMAYIVAGCVPPRELLADAVSITRDDDWKEQFLDAMQRAADFMEGQVESYRETLSRYRGSAPSLT